MKKILIVLSEWGFWGEELIGPLEVFDEKKYTSVLCTPTGKRPVALTPSMDPGFVDPPLGKAVTTEEMAEKVKRIDDPSNPRLDKPLNLSQMFPMQPYWSEPEVLRKWENYYKKVTEAQDKLQEYDALLIVGGSGPIVDMANNHRVHELILGFLRHDKPVAAECYGVTCLAFARNLNERKSIIRGKHVTGHCKEYDYLDGTGFMKSRGQFLAFNMGLLLTLWNIFSKMPRVRMAVTMATLAKRRP